MIKNRIGFLCKKKLMELHECHIFLTLLDEVA